MLFIYTDYMQDYSYGYVRRTKIYGHGYGFTVKHKPIESLSGSHRVINSRNWLWFSAIHRLLLDWHGTNMVTHVVAAVIQ